MTWFAPRHRRATTSLRRVKWWESSTRLHRTLRIFERAGVPRSAAMAMVGHKTEAVYRRYAIVDEVMLQESAAKLAIQERSHGRSGTSSGTNRQKPAAPFLVTM